MIKKRSGGAFPSRTGGAPLRSSYKAVTFLFVLIFAIFVFAQGHARTWKESIEIVEEKSEELWQKGLSLGGFGHLGTAYNEIDIPKHRCAILGRMFEMSDVISHLEHHPEPELSDSPSPDEIHALMVYAHSLSNWAFVASHLLEQNEETRKQVWNLDCVGKMGIGKQYALPVVDSAAKFRVEQHDLLVLGNIVSGFAESLELKLSENPGIDRVVLGSGGGNVVEALHAGVLIRKLGLKTTLGQSCYSACPLVFLGGVERTVWSPYPKLGFHKLSDGEGDAIGTTHPAYSLIFDYVKAMGSDPNFVLASILRAEPSDMYEPTLLDLCEYYVVTWVQRACFGGDKQ
ncbi:hypothetical protein [Tateyamaria sp. ANG-S1]|uniref:COG3904 family protein n=1 Tax=Tateyamaria sp. ANG-S1 TaxID=1577905 RepID=UPI00058028DF|nr:hypothetical protein [Tateyamaria sp. ANG-S1]KIC51767.1 hypothetical protein RA29_00160 [Tateyamaria sp. ANG-S1]